VSAFKADLAERLVGDRTYRSYKLPSVVRRIILADQQLVLWLPAQNVIAIFRTEGLGYQTVVAGASILT
jgi:hypothetical protein